MTTKPSTAPAASKPSPLAGWIEVFKAGTHTDSAGKRHTFGVGALDEMAANHVLGAAPAVLGHPKHDDPAYAWVDGFKREGDSLYAQFKDVNPAFEAGVQAGAYRNRSVSVYQDAANGWRVRHVGWLGAMPPAIDGLKPVAFAADDVACLEFSAPGYSLVWGLENVAQLLRKLRDNMIEKDGLEAADAALPAYQIDSALEAAAQARQEFADAREEDVAPAAELRRFNLQPDGDVMAITQEQLDAATAAATAAQADAAQARTDFAAASVELATLRAAGQQERVAAHIDKWKREGRLLAHEAEGMAEYMVSLDNLSAVAFTFAKAGNAEVKQTPFEFHVANMNARAPLIKLGAQPGGEDPGAVLDASDSAAIGAKAREFMASEAAAGRVISIAAAVDHVVKPGKA